MSSVHIGTSGYSYSHWKGIFYPENLSERQFFDHYARHFETVEINYSFYHIPTRKQIQTWYDQAPPGFLFSLKAPRRITHQMRLVKASGITRAFTWHAKMLRDKLGVILFQLPPSFSVDREMLINFISALPGGVRYAFEFRHSSWLDETIFVLLEEHQMGFCISDSPLFECPNRATAPFVYFRFHGHTRWVDYCYSEEELRQFADKIREHLDAGREVFAYFNNDANAYAVQNAQQLQELLLQ